MLNPGYYSQFLPMIHLVSQVQFFKWSVGTYDSYEV